MTDIRTRILAMLAERNAQLAEKEKILSEAEAAKYIRTPQKPSEIVLPEPTEEQLNTPIEGLLLNREQWQSILLADQGVPFCLIGAAGTGKTTSLRVNVKRACDRIAASLNIPVDSPEMSRHVALVSFTRRAVRNITRAVRPINCAHLCHSIHKFLGYAPSDEVETLADGTVRTRFGFAPTYTKLNPLLDIKLIIIDEASMVGYETLYKELREACPNAIFIFLGDINQLPPVMGSAVLGFKLATLPVVELTHVYRQALDSPIIRFQHEYTLRGMPVTTNALEYFTAQCTDEEGLAFRPFKQPFVDDSHACEVTASYFMKLLKDGVYSPEEDAILMPFNKKFGTIELNNYMAQALGNLRNAVVHEVICGFDKLYLAVGDRILYDKMDYVIKGIRPSPKYLGNPPQAASTNLTRWGTRIGCMEMTEALQYDTGLSFEEQLDRMFAATSDPDSQESALAKCSHELELYDEETGHTIRIDTSTELKKVEFAYATTIHKSQGSEWRKVWLILHHSHAVSLTRELLYTGMTRARDRLEVLYSPSRTSNPRLHTVNKAIQRAAISGVGWRSKIEVFKGKLSSGQITPFE